MAVKATFSADFTSFQEAVRKADLTLDKFIGSTTDVQRSLDRMVSNFSGQKVIAEATKMARVFEEVGGAAGLTQKELEKMGNVAREAMQKMIALGIEIPPGILKIAQAAAAAAQPLDKLAQGLTVAGQQASASGRLIAGMSQAGAEAAAKLSVTTSAAQGFGASLSQLNGLLSTFGIGLSVGAIVAFGKAVFDDADALTRLSDKTGVSTDWLQKFRIVTDDTGDSLESLATGINKLQQNLGKQNPDALKALAELHLNYDAIRRLAPEDQFLEIAAALRQVDDQDRQVALGTALMGRGFSENLATIKKGFDDVRAAAPAMSSETVKALDAAGDAWARFWRGVKGTAGEALADVVTLTTSEMRRMQSEIDAATARIKKAHSELIGRLGSTALQGSLPTPLAPPGVPTDVDAIERSLEAQRRLWNETNAAAKAAEDYQRKLDAVNGKIREATRDIGNLTPVQQEAVLMYERMGLSVEDIGIKLNVSVLAVKKFTEATKEQEKYLESLTAHIGAKAIPNFQGLILTWEQMLNTGKGLTFDGLIPMIKGFDDAARAELALKFYTDELTKSHIALQTQLAKVIGLMPDLSRNTNQVLREIRQGGPNAVDVFAHALEGLPGIMQRAFEGGGGLEGALKSFYVGLAKDLFGKGGVWEIETTKGMAAWSVAIQAGLGIGQAFTTPGSRGSNVLKYAGEGAALGSYVPGFGTAAGAGIGAAIGYFKKPEDEKAAEQQLTDFKRQLGALFDATATGSQRMEAGGDAWNKMIIQVREAYLATGHTAAEAMEVLGDATRHTREDVEKLPDDLAKINEILRQQQQDSNDLNAAMTKYKFTIEEMGPAFQKQELTKQALDLENSFRLLVGAGADANLVIDRMGEDINSFIKTALKTGTEVPREMQPMLEKMIEMGKLTDENGNVITDLGASGIKFSETMTQGFDRIVTALEKVLKALGWVDAAVEGLPDSHPIHIPIDFPMPNGPIIDEGFLAPHGAGIPGAQYAHGGVVPSHLSAGARVLPFMPMGSDTVPAMLTPGERVLSVPQNREYEGFLRGEPTPGSFQPGSIAAPSRPIPLPSPSAGPVTINLTLNVPADKLSEGQKMIEFLREELRSNPTGLYRDISTIALRAVA